MSEVKQKKSKPLKCTVVSASMEKSRTAVVPRLVKHPRIGKYIRRQTKLMFHDEQNTTKVGDLVLVSPCKPRSARKKFELVEVLQSAGE